MASATIQWLRDGLQMIQSRHRRGACRNLVPEHRRRYLVPAFAGLGAPDWDGYARGTLVGHDPGHRRVPTSRAPRWRPSRCRWPICFTPCSTPWRATAAFALKQMLRIYGRPVRPAATTC